MSRLASQLSDSPVAQATVLSPKSGSTGPTAGWLHQCPECGFPGWSESGCRSDGAGVRLWYAAPGNRLAVHSAPDRPPDGAVTHLDSVRLERQILVTRGAAALLLDHAGCAGLHSVPLLLESLGIPILG